MNSGCISGTLTLVPPPDPRRDIYEMNLPEGRMQYFHFKETNQPLAKHFHRLMEENFLCLDGGGVIFTAPVDTKGKISGPVTRHRFEPMDLVHVAKNHTHELVLRNNTRFVCYATAPFDPNNKDMTECPFTKEQRESAVDYV